MISLRDDQKVKVTLDPRDKKGNKATVDPASIFFKSSDEAVVTVEQVKDDPFSAYLVAGNPGVAQLDYGVDADAEAEGTQELKDFTAVEVKGGAASALGLTAGAKEEQPNPDAAGDHTKPEEGSGTPPADQPPAPPTGEGNGDTPPSEPGNTLPPENNGGTPPAEGTGTPAGNTPAAGEGEDTNANPPA